MVITVTLEEPSQAGVGKRRTQGKASPSPLDALLKDYSYP